MTATTTAPTSAQLYRRLISYVYPYRAIFALAVVAMIVGAASETGMAAVLRPIMDKGFVKPDPDFVRWMPFLLIGVLLARAAAGFVSSFAMSWVGRRVIYDLRQGVFHRLVYLPTHFFDDHSSATLVSKLIYDVEQAAVATTDALTLVTKDTLTAVALLGWMVYLDWKLTMVFVIAAPLIAIMTQLAARRFRRLGERIQDSIGGIAHVSKEAIIGHRVVKTFGGQQQEIGNFTRANERNRKQQVKKAVVAAAVAPLMMLVVGAAIATIIQIAVNRAGSAQITAGTFVSYVFAVVMLLGPLRRLANVNEKIQLGVAAANSMFGIMDRLPEPAGGDKVLSSVRGHIEYQHVSFRYMRSKSEVLRDVSFVVEPGQTVALVGASGSGKSTIASLLLGFYQPGAGEIRVDGIDIREVTLESLRSQMAIVTQETILFDDTVRNNIVYGHASEYSEERLQRAVEAAHVAEFSTALPSGLDTLVGEQGVRLSGGQRQRIAIARALYKDAPILVLDEATSSLDAVSERLVQEAMDRLMRNRTTLVIAHRLSTIEKADRILVLQQGRIVESGRHHELIARSGVYANLYRSQITEQAPLAGSA